MSLLNVSALQNVGASAPNIILNSDGTVILSPYSAAAPSPTQAGTLWFDGTSLQIRNAANTAWVAVGGGGSGTVTAVSGTAPINVATPTTTPVISIAAATTTSAGSLSAADKVKIDALPATIVSSVTGTLPITVATGTTTPVIAINAATAAAAGSIEIATLAEAATGTDATRALTPESGVPKDAAGMTGAAILPSGTTGQQPGTPVVGMQRLNLDSLGMEFWDGSKWVTLSPNSPAFSAYTSTPSAFFAPNIYTKAVFDTEVFDNSGFYNNATAVFQPTVPGYYQINSSIGLGTAGPLNIDTYIISIFKNGSEYLRGTQLTTLSLAAIALYATCSAVIYMDGTTDSVDMRILYQTSGAQAQILGGLPTASFFSAVLVGV